jgi:choline-phosphate cytidylyltransferase
MECLICFILGMYRGPQKKGRPDYLADLEGRHMRQLQQAKTAFPDTYLIVGVTGDSETHKRKGLTVLSAKERAESVRHCRWVDEVVEDCPWIINIEFLDKHKIDYVAHDDEPYGASEGDDIYGPIKSQGKFLVTQRTEGVSTTGIITKIVRDYEQYVGRQLKRGTTRQELNVSWLKKNELDIKRHVSELRDNIRQNWSTTGQELGKELRQFWQPSRPSSPAPSLRSNTPGRASGAKSPLALDRLNPMDAIARAGTPTGKDARGRNTDFAAGYAMGLIGGVKGWMQGSSRRNLSDSRAVSPNSGDDSPGAKSPLEESGRGRRGRSSAAANIDHDAAAKKQLDDESMAE